MQERGMYWWAGKKKRLLSETRNASINERSALKQSFAQYCYVWYFLVRFTDKVKTLLGFHAQSALHGRDRAVLEEERKEILVVLVPSPEDVYHQEKCHL